MRTITIPVPDDLEAKMLKLANHLRMSVDELIKFTVIDFGMDALRAAIDGETDLITDAFVYRDRPAAERVAKRLMAHDGYGPMPAELNYWQDGKQITEVFEPGDFALPESDTCRAVVEALKRQR